MRFTSGTGLNVDDRRIWSINAQMEVWQYTDKCKLFLWDFQTMLQEFILHMFTKNSNQSFIEKRHHRYLFAWGFVAGRTHLNQSYGSLCISVKYIYHEILYHVHLKSYESYYYKTLQVRWPSCVVVHLGICFGLCIQCIKISYMATYAFLWWIQHVIFCHA